MTKIELDNASLMVNVGKWIEIQATALPDDATNKELQWTSSNTEAVSIYYTENQGVKEYRLKAQKPGTAVITVAACDDSGVTAECTITVVKPATSIELNKPALELNVTETEQLQAILLPEDTSIQNVNWISEQPKIASVDENGLVTAHKAGTAKITATTCDGSNLTAECIVTVLQPRQQLN